MKLGDLRGVLEGGCNLCVVNENHANGVREIIYMGNLYGNTYQYNNYEVENITASCDTKPASMGGCEVCVRSILEIRVVKVL